MSPIDIQSSIRPLAQGTVLLRPEYWRLITRVNCAILYEIIDPYLDANAEKPRQTRHFQPREAAVILSSARRAARFAYGRAKVVSNMWSHPLNRGGKVQAVRDYVVWNAARYSMDARHIVRLPEGLEIIVGRKEKYGTAVYVHSLPDFDEMLFLAHLLQRDELFADVGANGGMYSVWVSGTAGAKSVAMEPVPSTYATLCQNVRLNNLESLVEPKQVAAGSISGDVLMSSGDGSMNHIVQGNVAGAIRTPVARLDDILGGKIPTAMKVDVEGFELQALRGAIGMLRDAKLKAIVLELQDWALARYGASEREVTSLLEDHGFRAHAYDPFTRRLSPLARHRGVNVIFVRDDAGDTARRLSSSRKVQLVSIPGGV